MLYWNIFYKRFYKRNKFTLGIKKKTKKFVNLSTKFVRERRFISKSLKGPQKSKSTKILIVLFFNLTTNQLQNIPPLSTFLGLYGINVIKFCEDFNKVIGKFYYDNLLINFRLIIYKDLTYQFEMGNLKINILLQSLYFFPFNNLVKNIVILIINKNFEGGMDDFIKIFTLYDLWFLNFIRRLICKFISFEINYNYCSSVYLPLLVSNLNSYYKKSKDCKYIKKKILINEKT